MIGPSKFHFVTCLLVFNTCLQLFEIAEVVFILGDVLNRNESSYFKITYSFSGN